MTCFREDLKSGLFQQHPSFVERTRVTSGIAIPVTQAQYLRLKPGTYPLGKRGLFPAFSTGDVMRLGPIFRSALVSLTCLVATRLTYLQVSLPPTQPGRS